MADRIGSVEPGKRADLVTLDLGRDPVLPESVPHYVVNAASRGDVTRTVVEGDVVYRREEGVYGIDGSDLEAAGEASAALWDRL